MGAYKAARLDDIAAEQWPYWAPIRHHFDIRHLARGRIEIGRKRVDPITHPPRGDGEHPAELAASEHPDRRARKNRLDHGSSSERTFCACSRRNSRNCSRSFGS